MKTKLYFQNLKCGGCAHTITSKLSELKSITDITVSNEDDSVSFDYQNETDLIEVKRVLSKIGYPEIGNDNSLGTKAKSYISCAIGKMHT